MTSYTTFVFYCLRCLKVKHGTRGVGRDVPICKDCMYEIAKEWVTAQGQKDTKTGE